MGKHHIKCLACGIERDNFPNLKFYKLPANDSRRTIWLNNMKRADLVSKKVSEDYRVCQKHFDTEQFGKSNVKLKREAIPTLLEEVSKINPGKKVTILEEIILLPNAQKATVEGTESQMDYPEYFHDTVSEQGESLCSSSAIADAAASQGDYTEEIQDTAGKQGKKSASTYLGYHPKILG